MCFSTTVLSPSILHTCASFGNAYIQNFGLQISACRLWPVYTYSLYELFTTLLLTFSECHDGRQQATVVETKGGLGERLWKQMKKLRLSDRTLSKSEGKAGMLEQQPAMTEEKVRSLEKEKQAVEARAEQADRRVSIQLLVA